MTLNEITHRYDANVCVLRLATESIHCH